MSDKYSIGNCIDAIRSYIDGEYAGMLRPAGEALRHPFLTPGSEQYPDVLWDWDAFYANVGLRQLLADKNDPELAARVLPHERGCVLNFLEYGHWGGQLPGAINRNYQPDPDDGPAQWSQRNNHKPCLAQHATLLVRADGEVEWLREKMQFIHFFLNNYRCHRRHEGTGLYFWVKTGNIGVDNDPCTYYRPLNSDASIYLNCFMVRELEAVIDLSQRLNLDEIVDHYQQDLAQLKAAIQEHCWDEWAGSFFSVDLALHEIEHDTWAHYGNPREYAGLINRRLIWSIFMPMWAGVATPEQAERMLIHLRDERSFACDWGVRTLGRCEKQYNVRVSGNPSSWLGPIWGMSNYLVWHGLVRYGFTEDAKRLAEQSIRLFGRDIIRTGAMHEYYLPANGEPALNHGFQNWNFLVLQMIAWLEGRELVLE